MRGVCVDKPHFAENTLWQNKIKKKSLEARKLKKDCSATTGEKVKPYTVSVKLDKNSKLVCLC